MQSYKNRKSVILKGYRHICRVCTPSSEYSGNKVLFDICPSCWLSKPEEVAIQKEIYLSVYEAIQEAGGLIPKSQLTAIMWKREVSFMDDELKAGINLMFAKGFIQSTTINNYRHFSFTKAGVLHLKTLEAKPVVVENQMALAF